MGLLEDINYYEKTLKQMSVQLKQTNKLINDRMISYIRHHGLLVACTKGEFRDEHIKAVDMVKSMSTHVVLPEQALSNLICKPIYSRLDDLWSVNIYQKDNHQLLAKYELTRSDINRLSNKETGRYGWDYHQVFNCEELAVQDCERNTLKELIDLKKKELEALEKKYRSL